MLKLKYRSIHIKVKNTETMPQWGMGQVKQNEGHVSREVWVRFNTGTNTTRSCLNVGGGIVPVQGAVCITVNEYQRIMQKGCDTYDDSM